MAVEVKVKKWGNSMGVILPKILVEKAHLKEDDEILIEVVKEADLSKIFGSIKEKDRKMSGQKMKDMVRKGWK